MKTTERDTNSYHVTISDNELFCPFCGDTCRADGCALSVFVESKDSTVHYCGLVANDENTAWNNTGLKLRSSWIKEVYREEPGDD